MTTRSGPSGAAENRARDVDGGARTLPGLLGEVAERFPGNLALIGDGRRWTYTELASESARVARGLVELGVKPGDRIGILLPNWPEFFSAAFGVQACGATAVLLNTMATPTELGHYLEISALSLLIYTPRFLKHDYQATLEALGATGEGSTVVPERHIGTLVAVGEPRPPGAHDFAQIGGRAEGGARALHDHDVSSPTAPAAMFFTSGSTALPKALVHSHAALVHQARVIADAFGLTAEDRTWGCLPLFFTGGYVINALTAFARGAGVVLQDHFEAEVTLDLMESEGITFYSGWQLAPALCDHPSFPRRQLRLKKGIFANPELGAKLLAPDHVAVGVYGMSETATFICQGRWDDPPELRTRGFGRPLPRVELKIVDPESGAERGVGEVGEIIVRGPSLMLGYLGTPIAETLDRDGFLHTGDYGRVDESGTLLFDGRLKEVIKTAGVNVAAAEVEACLEGVEGVAAAYVVPVPHPVRGENVAGFVVPRPGARIDAAELLAHCRREMASYKVPRHLFVISADQVPRTGTQKVDKPRLRRDAASQAGGPSDLAGSD